MPPDFVDLRSRERLIERRRRKREGRSWAGHGRRDHRDAGKRAKRFGRKREFHPELPPSFLTASGEEHVESEQLMNRTLRKQRPARSWLFVRKGAARSSIGCFNGLTIWALYGPVFLETMSGAADAAKRMLRRRNHDFAPLVFLH
jgi:hypothetical protein